MSTVKEEVKKRVINQLLYEIAIKREHISLLVSKELTESLEKEISNINDEIATELEIIELIYLHIK